MNRKTYPSDISREQFAPLLPLLEYDNTAGKIPFDKFEAFFKKHLQQR